MPGITQTLSSARVEWPWQAKGKRGCGGLETSARPSFYAAAARAFARGFGPKGRPLQRQRNGSVTACRGVSRRDHGRSRAGPRRDVPGRARNLRPGGPLRVRRPRRGDVPRRGARDGADRDGAGVTVRAGGAPSCSWRPRQRRRVRHGDARQPGRLWTGRGGRGGVPAVSADWRGRSGVQGRGLAFVSLPSPDAGFATMTRLLHGAGPRRGAPGVGARAHTHTLTNTVARAHTHTTHPHARRNTHAHSYICTAVVFLLHSSSSSIQVVLLGVMNKHFLIYKL